MKSPPYMRTWVDDYIADTLDLDAEEMGAYWLLLLHAWKHPDCSLPDDDRKLARMARVGLRRWKTRIKPAVLRYWQIEGGRLFNGKQRKERAFNESLSESKSRNAKARWETQTPENKQTKPCNRNAKADATAMLNLESQNPYNISPNGDCAASDTSDNDFSFSDFEEEWADMVREYGLPAMRSGARARRMKLFGVRKRQYPLLEDWQAAFRTLREAKWMHGDNNRGWRCDVDDFLEAKKFSRLVEGKYVEV